ncbi:MAG: GNAT family N-acetyltransferase [Myxococcota bacterium]
MHAMSDDFLLRTPRLLLRPHRPDDAPFMVELNADPEVVRYTGDTAFGRLAEAEEVIALLMRQYAERRMGRFMVVERESGQRLGFCGLKLLPDGEVDLGYRLLRSAWGQGLATEASRACLDYGFGELELRRIVADVMPQNSASLRVVAKLGFTLEGPRHEDGMDLLRFALHAPDGPLSTPAPRTR